MIQQRWWSMLLVTGFLTVLAGVGLVACGANVSPQGSSPSASSQTTQSQSQTHTTTTQAHTQGTQHQPAQSTSPAQSPQVQKCGIVVAYGALKVVPRDENAPQAQNCFWQAFQHCRPASIIFTSNSVGKGILGKTFIRTFTIQNVHGACMITDALQQGTSPTALSPATTYTCSGLTQQARALEVHACGRDGTVLVQGA